MATSIEIDDMLKRRTTHWIMRERFKQEALLSWSVYQETGRHLTGEEVHKWLNTWGTDKEAEPPACHESASLPILLKVQS